MHVVSVAVIKSSKFVLFSPFHVVRRYCSVFECSVFRLTSVITSQGGSVNPFCLGDHDHSRFLIGIVVKQDTFSTL